MGVLTFFKRNKTFYYIKNGFLDALPRSFFNKKLKLWIGYQNKYPKKLIEERVTYYINNKLPQKKIDGIQLKNFQKKGHKSMYYYDLMKYGRYFNQNLVVKFLFGDVDTNVASPTFVKSRPINHNGNSVLLPLNKLRHFNFIDDTTPFSDKKDEIVWRGITHKENRKLLVEKFKNRKGFNILPIFLKDKNKTNFISIKEQLKYKFILSIEGNDVATNLKWIMSSNSLCFMPKPKFETWYMEGKLRPNHHYVLIKDDYSDMEEKMNFYSKNIEEAEKIIQNAKNWTLQFKDTKLEKVLSLLVMNSYFKQTQQLK
ncbi:lipopolysaccharide biosynthesis protein [Polaribacter sp. Z014]|uniref:glycosyl transferase family 90 n=1 Tax=Polaribacter sp. Z014 TaxID=2927126 RepID=UPI0020203672|nr:glycosyl transferase family 90 [Polaribacter sp. Z014]MCL7763072.1 lipopolysaccharide biosynthesis protein [Polaribacter sp. Z014]